MLKRCLLIDWLDVRYDDEQTSVIINNHILRFSLMEYKLIRIFLLQGIVKESTLFETLALEVTDVVAQRLLARYINKVHHKIAPFELGIHRICSYGYILLPDDPLIARENQCIEDTPSSTCTELQPHH